QFVEAEPLFLDVLNELPFSVPSMFLLEAIYAETGQHQKRLEMNARRLNLRPKSDWYLFYLIALSYEELSEIDRAFHWIYRSLESNPHGIEYLPTLDEFKKLSKHPQWERLKSSWNKKNFEKVRNEYINPDYNAIINYPFPEPVKHKDFDHFVYIALTDGDYLLRIVALEMIVATGNPKGLEVVLEVLRIEVDPDVLERGIYALLGVPYENLTERLVQFCAETDNPWIDTFAGYVIGLEQPDVAAGILRDAIFTPAPHECHEDAVRMLGRLENRSGEDALNYIINNHPSLSIRNAAGEALKGIR
ncbi:MAG: hypothetical protein MI702_03975, partial [Chlorobiales bacterium]|nr:hypothetical protein [Chlorobiales bacterium]